MLANIPFIEHDTLKGIWKHGSVNIRAVEDAKSVRNKILSYITKGINDPRLKGQHRYLASRNLQRPIILIGEDASCFIQQMNLKQEQIKYSSSYNHELHGEVKYTEYKVDSNWKLQDVLILSQVV